MKYVYYNANPLDKLEDDCVCRALSCATNRSWDSVYDELSDLAQYNGTLMNDGDFVRWYLDTNFERVSNPPQKVKDIARRFGNNIMLCTTKGHIFCIKYGVIYDTFNPMYRDVEHLWIVK